MVLVPIWMGVTLFRTIGVVVARTVTPDTASWVGSNERWSVALLTDFWVWFAAIWALQMLWLRLRHELEERDSLLRSEKQSRSHPLVAAMFLALPFSSLPAFSIAKLLRHGSFPGVGLFVLSVALTLAFFTVVVCGLFVLAIRIWPPPML
jgi:hypothetical protein